MPATPVIIDTDPGTDDAIALLMALESPALEVLAVTTVGGNAHLSRATANALRILEYVGRTDIPVAPGASRPLKGRFTYAYDFHGPGGLGVALPRPTTPTAPERAVQLMARTFRERPGQVTLIALGPLTNVARLLQQHPEVVPLIPHMVVMGGAVEVPGNITPYAEFNFYNDPWAADRVLSCGVPITLVDLSVCRRALITRDGLGPLTKGGRAAHLASRVLYRWFQGHPQRDAYDLCDPLAMAVAMEPGLLATQPARVSVETQVPERLGQTVLTGSPGHVRVPTGVDVPGFFHLMFKALGAGTEGA